jgi:4-hydroxybenzoate polyprenyltransferase
MDQVLSPEKQKLPADSLPLVVDLDGTLVKTDLLVESLFALVKQNPLYVILLPFWLLKGKGYLKSQIHRRVNLDVSSLPYQRQLIGYLEVQQNRGRPLVLATGSDERIARQVADHLRLFQTVLASNGNSNLSPHQKRERLVGFFGEKGFDYAGNNWRDLQVWCSARRAIVVSSSAALSRRAARVAEVERVFGSGEGWLIPYLRALRPQQWLKNLLVFVPLVMAHRFDDFHSLGNASLAFLAFALCASSVYIINDLADLPSDRQHPRKRERPFASGEVSLIWGVASVPVLLGLSLLVCLFLPPLFLAVLLVYFLLNLGYSFTLKRVAVLDVVVLAGLYTMRIMGGAATVDIWPSSWLLAFSNFLFFSLALVKRYAELVLMRGLKGETAHVRGYQIIDLELLASMGGGSGYVAVLVLAIYISSGAAEILYTKDALLWLLCPLLLYWISYVWLVAHRGRMHDDPLLFTLKDPVSRIVILLAAVIILLAI